MDDNDSQCMYSDNIQVRHAVACNNTHKNVLQEHDRFLPINTHEWYNNRTFHTLTATHSNYKVVPVVLVD